MGWNGDAVGVASVVGAGGCGGGVDVELVSDRRGWRGNTPPYYSGGPDQHR